LLQQRRPRAEGLSPPYRLAASRDVIRRSRSFGDEVLSVGFPASVDSLTDINFDASLKDGKISSEHTIGGGLVPVFEISAAVSAGMSGGPTINLDGEVIGVNSFGIAGKTQPFNFIMQASLIDEILARARVDNQLGAVGDAYRAGLAAYFGGDRAAALEAFDEVLDLAPSHQLAQDYRGKAAKLPRPEPKKQTSQGLPVELLAAMAAVCSSWPALPSSSASVPRIEGGPRLPPPARNRKPQRSRA